MRIKCYQDPDLNVLVPRLLANQQDIGDQIKPIVGEAKGNQLAALLTQHIKFAAAAITAATNKSPTLNQDLDNLFANSDEVARFLTSLNPEKLPYNATQPMFERHNRFVVEMVQKRIAGDYANEIKLYDAYYNEILEMADHIYQAL